MRTYRVPRVGIQPVVQYFADEPEEDTSPSFAYEWPTCPPDDFIEQEAGDFAPEDEHSLEVARSSSGLTSVDRLLGGGLPLGRLGAFCAYQGRGKTTYGLQIARKNAERGLHTRFITFSMRGEECVEWYETALRHGPPEFRSEEYLDRVLICDLNNRDCNVDGVQRIENLLLADRAKGTDVRVVVIDSLEAMADLQPGSAYYERLGNLALSLREMATRNGVAIWITVQWNDFSRGENRSAQRAMVCCGKISDSASVWLGLHTDRHLRRWHLECHKNDGGLTFSAQIQPDFPTRRFLDVEQEILSGPVRRTSSLR